MPPEKLDNIEGAFYHINRMEHELNDLRIQVLSLLPITARLGVTGAQDTAHWVTELSDKVTEGLEASKEAAQTTDRLLAKTEEYKRISETLLQRVAAVEQDNRTLWEAILSLHGEEGARAIDAVRAKYIIWRVLGEQEQAFNGDDEAAKEAALNRVAETREKFGEEVWAKAKREYVHYKEKGNEISTTRP